MPTSLTLNAGDTQVLETPVASIRVDGGSLVVTPPASEETPHPKPEVVQEDTSYLPGGTAGLALCSPLGAIYRVTYAEGFDSGPTEVAA